MRKLSLERGLFLESRVYQDYAARYLAPEQIDLVDASRYLGDCPT